MPIIKLSLIENEYVKITELAQQEKLSVQDYIRYKVFGEKSPAKFTPEEAERRAVEKFTKDDKNFSLPDIYGEEEWRELDPRMTGVFGKRFFNYLKTSNDIEYAGMSTDGRRATYRIVKESNYET